MKFLSRSILLILLNLFISQYAFANTDDQSFAVYVTNSTPYAISLMDSNYNKTPINYVSKTVTSGVQQLKIASVTMENGKANISFLAHLGNDAMAYSNTPLVIFSFDNLNVNLNYEPSVIQVNGQKYAVTVQSAMQIDRNTHSILVTFDNI